MTFQCLVRLWLSGMMFSTLVAAMELPSGNLMPWSHEISTRKRKRCENLYRNQTSSCKCPRYEKSKTEILQEEVWEIAMFQMQLDMCFSSPFQNTTVGMTPFGELSQCFCGPEREDTPYKPRKNENVDISAQSKNGTVVPKSIPYTDNNLKKLVRYLEEKSFSKKKITAMAGYRDKDNIKRNFSNLQSLKNEYQIQKRYDYLLDSILEDPTIKIKKVFTFMNGS